MAAVRLVLRCIVGQLVGCYGDLAGSVQGVYELLLSPLSLRRLVIKLSRLSWVCNGKSTSNPPASPLILIFVVMNQSLLSLF